MVQKSKHVVKNNEAYMPRKLKKARGFEKKTFDISGVSIGDLITSS
jgi:hypothetical protein